MSHGAAARKLFRNRHWGVLATLSHKLGDHPFASILPYLTDHVGRPLILVSRLAEHTKNIEHDNRVSLLVHEGDDDVQEHARATLVGRAAAQPASEELKARYLRYFPDARQYFDLGDFRFYRIEPEQVRFIGGFGAIHWVSAEAYLVPAGDLSNPDEQRIIARLNERHADALHCLCGTSAPGDTVAVGLDCDGLDMRTNGALRRLSFAQAADDASQLEQALAALLQQPFTLEP
ncbi:MAG: pyridoxamine 5'-phosphate oxidase family protein [Pseudomonadota bacterium]